MVTRRDGFAVKMQRVDEHLRTLQSAFREFVDSEPRPYPIVAEFDPKRDWYDVRAIVARDTPQEWSVLIGECLYDMRSALDHLAWHLAVASSGHGNSTTEFPIFLERAKFFEVTRQGRPTPRSGARKAALFNPAAFALIEGLQPYHRLDGPPDDHPLWLLQLLCNEDKHQTLHMTGGVVGSGTLELTDENGYSFSGRAQ